MSTKDYLLDRNHEFLFSLFRFKNIDRDDKRAREAFGILLRCKEFNWKTSWSLAIYMFNAHDPENDSSFSLAKVEQLRSLMLQDPSRKEELLKELLQVLVQNGRFMEALEEIELYLPSFPYQDNPVLHIYAGAISLYMSQDPSSRGGYKSPEDLLEEAEAHLTRVTEIDAKNSVAHFFLDQIGLIKNCGSADSNPDLSGDEVSNLTLNIHIGNAPGRTERGQMLIDIARAARERYEATPPTSEDGGA